MALKDEFPSIEAGFSFVVPSYAWLLTRIEAADGRLNQNLALASTITAGVPAVARAVQPNISFASGYFLIAVLLFLAGAVIALIARMKGGVLLPNPAAIYEQLDDEPERFKANAIYFAGTHFQHNVALAQAKLTAAVLATACLVLEVVSLMIWMAR